MSAIIKVENVSKQYRLGQVGTGTIKDDLKRWWHRARGKQDPFLKIGQSNERDKVGKSEYVWALRDINFEVQPGEVLGIIGKNGAGKSTLLKILSRVTEPTTGKITMHGRVASLLEVGTGFHPDLTGRENIFLNGAILGMNKAEVKRKFDEIVDFAGVERYIDTPVKRYSSGMHVRLGFAVAAHLEPDIMIVDEVLAVGDAEFQKKCLGKMKQMSHYSGRTVLFVSHNLTSITNLCNKALIIKNGSISGIGNVNTIVEAYLNTEENKTNTFYLEEHSRTFSKHYIIKKGWFEDWQGVVRNKFLIGENIRILFSFKSKENLRNVLFGFGIENTLGQRIFSMNNEMAGTIVENINSGIACCNVQSLNLAPGRYFVSLSVVTNQIEWEDYIERCLEFEIIERDFFGTGKMPLKEHGDVLFTGNVEVKKYGNSSSL